MLPSKVTLDQVDLWFQDETRVGQQTTLSRIWAMKGTRPRVVKQQQFLCQYIYGAACPSTGDTVGFIAPFANHTTMQIFLDILSEKIDKGRHAVLIMDQAGWHKSKLLKIPDNISFLFLPAYSPEINPVEMIWQNLKDNFLKNRVYKSLDHIMDVACEAWNNTVSNKNNIINLCNRKWLRLS